MRKIILLLINVGTIITANCQTVSSEQMSSSGESFQNSTYLLDWSLGECITETNNSGAYILTQGFHQSNLEVTAVDDLRSDISISVYPNPTTNFILLNFKSSEKYLKVITITDINGKVLQQTKTINHKEQIDFSDYVDGIYFLTVKQDNKLIKSFKIIKN